MSIVVNPSGLGLVRACRCVNRRPEEFSEGNNESIVGRDRSHLFKLSLYSFVLFSLYAELTICWW